MILNLNNLPVYCISNKNPIRVERINDLTKNLQLSVEFVDIRFPEDFKGNRKIEEQRKSVEYVLSKDGPVLMIEDDVNVTEHYKNIIDVPCDADAIWLGTSIYGLIPDWSMYSLRDNIFHQHPTIIGEYEDFYKIDNMLSCHAVLFLSDNYKREMINYMKYTVNDVYASDIIFAATMKHFNIYACKRPYFWQDDGAHNSTPTMIPLEDIFK